MPIRPENKDRYPADWKQISLRIRKQAGNKCEWCKAPNGTWIYRGKHSDAGTYMLEDGYVFNDKTGEKLGRAKGSEYSGKLVKVVLTVAHLDHTPENIADENLKALYDAPMRAAGIRERKKAADPQKELF